VTVPATCTFAALRLSIAAQLDGVTADSIHYIADDAHVYSEGDTVTIETISPTAGDPADGPPPPPQKRTLQLLGPTLCSTNMLAELHVVVAGDGGVRVTVAVDNWQLPRGGEEAPMSVAELHRRVRKAVGGMLRG
jgi:hypothetical protein